LVQNVQKESEKLTQQILDFSKRLAGRSRIKAVCVYSDSISDLPLARSVIQVLLIVHDFQPKLMNYVKVLDERSIVAVAADVWVFERDVDRGLLGEALAW
jgi:hypothetical protein